EQRAIVKHDCNHRNMRQNVSRYAKSFAKSGLIPGVGGSPWFQWSADDRQERSLPLRAFTWGHRTDAAYLAFVKYSKSEAVQDLLRTGLEDVDEYHERMPDVAIHFLKNEHNEHHNGTGVTFKDMLDQAAAMISEWHDAKDSLGVSSRNSDYQKQWYDWITKHDTYKFVHASPQEFTDSKEIWSALKSFDLWGDLEPWLGEVVDFMNPTLVHKNVIAVWKSITYMLIHHFKNNVPTEWIRLAIKIALAWTAPKAKDDDDDVATAAVDDDAALWILKTSAETEAKIKWLLTPVANTKAFAKAQATAHKDAARFGSAMKKWEEEEVRRKEKEQEAEEIGDPKKRRAALAKIAAKAKARPARPPASTWKETVFHHQKKGERPCSIFEDHCYRIDDTLAHGGGPSLPQAHVSMVKELTLRQFMSFVWLKRTTYRGVDYETFSKLRPELTAIVTRATQLMPNVGPAAAASSSSTGPMLTPAEFSKKLMAAVHPQQHGAGEAAGEAPPGEEEMGDRDEATTSAPTGVAAESGDPLAVLLKSEHRVGCLKEIKIFIEANLVPKIPMTMHMPFATLGQAVLSQVRDRQRAGGAVSQDFLVGALADGLATALPFENFATLAEVGAIFDSIGKMPQAIVDLSGDSAELAEYTALRVKYVLEVA
ncbi:unnamed protein product, partial [Prorocentrum cordatum]